MSQCKPAATPIVQDTLVGKVDTEEKVKSRDSFTEDVLEHL